MTLLLAGSLGGCVAGTGDGAAPDDDKGFGSLLFGVGMEEKEGAERTRDVHDGVGETLVQWDCRPGEGRISVPGCRSSVEMGSKLFDLMNLHFASCVADAMTTVSADGALSGFWNIDEIQVEHVGIHVDKQSCPRSDSDGVALPRAWSQHSFGNAIDITEIAVIDHHSDGTSTKQSFNYEEGAKYARQNLRPDLDFSTSEAAEESAREVRRAVAAATGSSDAARSVRFYDAFGACWMTKIVEKGIPGGDLLGSVPGVNLLGQLVARIPGNGFGQYWATITWERSDHVDHMHMSAPRYGDIISNYEHVCVE